MEIPQLSSPSENDAFVLFYSVGDDSRNWFQLELIPVQSHAARTGAFMHEADMLTN